MLEDALTVAIQNEKKIVKLKIAVCVLSVLLFVSTAAVLYLLM